MVLGGVSASANAGTKINYRYAVVDYIIEEYVLQTYVEQRNSNRVTLADPYNEVILRSGSTFTVENRSQAQPTGFEDYELGNAGLTLGSFQDNVMVDSGISSGLTINDISAIYPTMSIRDFEFRENSALLGNGDRFNLGIPTYQQPVTVSQSTGPAAGSITVQSTEYFATEGYLFTESGNVIQYTSKTNTSFNGCTVIRGGSTITAGDDIIPFAIV